MQVKEEAIFTIIVVIFVLIFLAILFLVFIARNNTRKNKLLYENERIRKEFEKALLNSRLEIQEYTLNHVSREIHDNIGQTLTLARLQLNSAEDISELENTDELLEKAISDLRTLSHSLNTNFVKDNGFVPSLENLLKQFGKSGQFEVEFRNNARDFRLSDENGLIIFRVVQEILTNVIKHAEASKINLTLSQSEKFRNISIEDNGKGFELGKMKSEGIGLKNIRERVQMTGGHLNISSGLNLGTQIKISLPNEENNKNSVD